MAKTQLEEEYEQMLEEARQVIINLKEKGFEVKSQEGRYTLESYDGPARALIDEISSFTEEVYGLGGWSASSLEC